MNLFHFLFKNFLFLKKIFIEVLVDLQYCVSLKSAAQWFSHTYIHVYLYIFFFPYRLLHNIE